MTNYHRKVAKTPISVIGYRGNKAPADLIQNRRPNATLLVCGMIAGEVGHSVPTWYGFYPDGTRAAYEEKELTLIRPQTEGEIKEVQRMLQEQRGY